MPAYTVLSPHLDDAALSCSLFLAANPGSSIVTVFANGPVSVRPLPPWDRAARCFADGADVMAVRRQEDARAAALVGATALHLQYWDRQYRNDQYNYGGPEGDDLIEAIVADLAAMAAAGPATSWLVPLGLGHPDHRLTAEVGIRLAGQLPADWYVYEDLPYALADGDDVTSRKADLQCRGFELTADGGLAISTDRAIKKAVIACHVSQRRGLGRGTRDAARAEERIWTLASR
jgi:LmbE family N-acetylglucosaminyl deacetylase